MHFNTGCQGKPDGSYISSETNPEDFNLESELSNNTMLKQLQVSRHVVSSYSEEIYPSKADFIINAWNYSSITYKNKRDK